MKTNSLPILLCLGAFNLASAFAADADWTRFRGPAGDGIAEGAHPPLKWSGSQNLAWKAELPGPGASSPIRHGNRIFVTCYSGYGTGGREGGDLSKLVRHLVCVDAASGKILWNSSVPGDAAETAYTRLNEHGYASQTPVTDGEKVFVFFGKSGVLAFDMAGKKLWQTNVGKESGRQGWGSATSLILYKNSVIVNAADESQSIRALDKATGKELWKAEGSGMTTCYNTPTLVNVPGGTQELVVAVQNEVWGLNPDTGKLRWFAEVPLSGNLAASIVTGDGVVYAFGGNRGPGTAAIRLGGKNKDGTEGFAKNRPGWAAPIHELLVKNGVNIVFHGHDHLFAKQDRDGIIYQCVPQPGNRGNGTAPRNATEYSYVNGKLLGSPGYMRMTVTPDKVTAELVRSYQAGTESPGQKNRQVDFTYTINAGKR